MRMTPSRLAFIALAGVASVLAVSQFARTPAAIASPANDKPRTLVLPAATPDNGSDGFGAFEVFAYPSGQPEFGRKIAWEGTQVVKAYRQLGVDPVNAPDGTILVLTVAGELGGYTGSIDLAMYPSVTGDLLWMEETTYGEVTPVAFNFVPVRFE
jgi:hypothetical protein